VQEKIKGVSDMRNTQKISLLVIDDDPNFCAILRSAAQGLGMEVDIIQDIIELQGVINLPKYDIVVLDFELGAGTGFDVADFVTSLSGNVPIVMVTGKNLEQIPMQKSPKSINSYISKSEGFQSILRKVKTMVSKRPVRIVHSENAKNVS
jgi:two-component system OmpR family response regulator